MYRHNFMFLSLYLFPFVCFFCYISVPVPVDIEFEINKQINKRSAYNTFHEQIFDQIQHSVYYTTVSLPSRFRMEPNLP